MAVIGGVFFFDGRPTDSEQRWLSVSLRTCHSDAVSMVAQDGVVMARADCDPRTELRPGGAGTAENGVVVAWDGRLDNRDDLMLRLYGGLSQDATDAAIAAAVFERWGTDGLRHLIGDWSVAIWDRGHRMIHLARDYMGVRPLYYCRESGAVYWSSSLGELATRVGRANALDEAFVAHFMTLAPVGGRTPYAGISAVPTATAVSISTDGGETRRRYWTLAPGYVRYRDRRDYEAELRRLWMEAVAARLRTAGTVWAELSGGLDSSSIVCMAAALVRAGRVLATGLQPLSHVTFESPEGDERRFIEAVEQAVGLRSEILGVEEHDALRDPEWDWVTPKAVQGVQVGSIRRVRAGGGRVVLSGRMGDVVMGCAPDNSVAVFDDFAGGRGVTALGKMRQWSRARRVPFIEVAGDVITEAMLARLGRSSRFSATRTQIAGRDLLVERLRDSMPTRQGTSRATAEGPARLAQRQTHELVHISSTHAQLEVQSGALDVAYTYPYTHRPLVEFMLSIPGEELSAPGELRSLMRRAFRGIVPDKVLQRISKGYYPPAVMRATRAAASSLLPAADTQVVRRGWLQAERLDVALRALIDGGGVSSELQRVVRLEQWLLSRDRWGPTAMPQRKEVTTNEVLIA